MSGGWGSQDWQQSFNQLGEQFLKSLEAGKNVLLESEWSKYLPLFKKDALADMSKEAATKLAAEYNYKFSPYEPITVISQELDPDGVEFIGFRYNDDDIRVGDGKKHKVVAVYPARFRKLKTINELGPERSFEVIGLLSAAAMSKNGLDPRMDKAYKQVSDAMDEVNPNIVTEEDIKNNEIEAKLMGIPLDKPEEPQASKDDDPVDFDADWS